MTEVVLQQFTLLNEAVRTCRINIQRVVQGIYDSGVHNTKSKLQEAKQQEARQI